MRVLLIAGLIATAGSVQAQPTVRVRAETRIELSAESDELGPRIRGRLYDDAGDPLPRERVTLRVDAPDGTQTVRSFETDALGWFETHLPMNPDDAYEAEVLFEGDDLHERVRVRRTLDLRRAEVRLEVELAAELDLSSPTHGLRVVARGPATGADLPIQIEDELGRALAEGRTDAGGALELALPSGELGPPGPGRLTIRTPGDARRASARTEIGVLRVRPTRLTLTATCADADPCERAAPTDEVLLRGTLDTDAGPLAERAIGLYRGAEHVGTVLTDAQGAFEHRWPPGPHFPRARVVARFESDAPGLPNAQSAPVVFEVAGAAVLGPLLWSVLPLLILGGVLLAWRRRLRIAPPPPAPPAEAGVRAAAPAGRTRRATTVRGRLLSQRDGQPLDGRVEVRSERADTRVEAITGGRFEFDLPHGTHALRFVAPAMAPAEVVVTIPHRGEWMGMEVRVESWRARVLRVAGRLGERVFGARWARRTVHELAEHASAPPEVRAIAAQAEEHAYGPHDPPPAKVEELDARARRLDDPG